MNQQEGRRLHNEICRHSLAIQTSCTLNNTTATTTTSTTKKGPPPPPTLQGSPDENSHALSKPIYKTSIMRFL